MNSFPTVFRLPTFNSKARLKPFKKKLCYACYAPTFSLQNSWRYEISSVLRLSGASSLVDFSDDELLFVFSQRLQEQEKFEKLVPKRKNEEWKERV